jgi:hypothetical protein
MVEGSTMANTGAIKLAYYRVQHSDRNSRNQKCACCSSSFRRHHTTILQAEQAHQSHCILQKIHKQLQTFQDQQANSHSDHPRSRPGSDLLCEDGTTDFICTRIQGLDETARGCNYQFPQDIASIHWSRRYSKSRDTTTAVNSSLPSNALDDSAC